MLKHVVFFKFKPEVGEDQVDDLVNSLRKLVGTVPEIREFLVGRDVVRSERSYDLALVSGFDDLAGMNRYQVHPEHQAVVTKVKALCSSVVAVDFEC